MGAGVCYDDGTNRNGGGHAPLRPQEPAGGMTHSEREEARMKKRLLSGVLCLCMVLTLLPVPARAAEPTTVTDAAGLESAIITNGEIKLSNDITVSQSLRVDKIVTLDLNGHTITATGASTLFTVGQIGTDPGHLTVTDRSTGDNRGSITGQSKLFHVSSGHELSLGGGIVLTSNTTTDPALQNEGGTVNVLTGGFFITSQMSSAIYNEGTFKGNDVNFTASTGSSGNGAALKLDGGTVTGLNATVTSGRTDPAILVADGSVEITGGSYTTNYSSDGALHVDGGTVKLKGGTFHNSSPSGKAIALPGGSPYAGLLETGFGYTTDNGTTFLTNETELKAATSLTVKAVSAQSAHTHAVSVRCETDSGTQVEFQALPDMSASQQGGHTLNGGSYYLDANTTVNGSLKIDGNVTLCLNGHTLTPGGSAEIVTGTYAAISVPQGSSLSVCDCGETKGKISFQTSESDGRAAIGGAGNVTLHGCTVETSKTSAAAVYGLYNAGGTFTLYDSRISATHTTSGENRSPHADAVEGRAGTTVIHGGTLSAIVTNITAYTDGNSSARGLSLGLNSTAHLLGNPSITTSNNTNENNQADVYVPSPSTQFWLSKNGEGYSGAALTVEVSETNYSNRGGGTVIRGVGEKGNAVTIKDAPNGFVGTVIDTEGRKDLVLTGPYKVTFNANGGQGTMTDLAFTGWTDSKALTANGFTGADDAIFRSWNTKADGTGTSYADRATVSGLAYGGTVTLYAQWGAAQGHTHVWDTGWTFDADYHWHQCTATDCFITDYKDNQYAAQAKLSPHNKTWVNTDPAQHWKTCACGWTGARDDHDYDNDQDAECNTCGYTRTVTPPTPPDSGSTEGKVEVGEGAPPVTVGTETLNTLKDLAGTPAADETITVKLTVEKKEESNAEGAAEIKGAAAGKTVEFLDLSLVKTVTGGTKPGDSPIEDTGDKVLEIVVSYDLSGKKDVTVYRYHGSAVQELIQDGTKVDGRFQLGANSITIYTTKFSTYAIGYTPDSGGNQPQPPSGGGDFSGGGGDFSGGYIPPVYPVELPASVSGGKITVSHKSAPSGTRVTLTLTLDEGYEIGGVAVTDQNGKTVAVTDRGGGKYTFTMPSGRVTVKAEFTKLKGGYADCPRDNSCPVRRFPDADPAAWYHDGVHYCVDHGLMSSYNGLFRPDDNLSRADFVQVLHNLEGNPVVNYLTDFEDVPGGAWYAEAVRWAASRQIVGGYGNGRFDPNHNISREELAVMLWRYAGRPSAAGKRLNFADAEKASGWAVEALCWAVDQGILQGKDGGLLDPKGMTTRAEAAAVLQRVFGREQ